MRSQMFAMNDFPATIRWCVLFCCLPWTVLADDTDSKSGTENAPGAVLLRYKFRKGEEVLTKVTHLATTKT